MGKFGEASMIAFEDIRRDRPQHLNTNTGRCYDVAWTGAVEADLRAHSEQM